jgi:flagellar assembly protein FliH
MDKSRVNPSEVKPFSFNSLEGTPLGGQSTTRNFEFRDLSGGATAQNKPAAKIIRSEREAEAKTQFKIDAIVRDLRGLTGQEKDDLEARINQQVEKRLKETREAAYREGLEKGRMEGADAALQEAMAQHEKQIVAVEEMVTQLQAQCDERLNAHRHDIYETSKRLLKWLVLKEVKDDGYVPKLLEKLVLELNQRTSLIIRVNQEQFAAMPAIVEALEKRIGNLPNVRIEPAMEMSGPGLILETENGILDASPEALMQTIDKLYESVVNHG